MKILCKHKEHPEWYGKMSIVAFTGTGYNYQQAICLNCNGDLKAFDIEELQVIDENYLNEVTENQVKETVKCAECKYLILVNQKDCYARCEKTKQNFLPFGIDTREYTCKYAESKNEVTENE